MQRYLLHLLTVTIFFFLLSFTARAQSPLDSLGITALSPQPNQVDVAATAQISVTFNQSIETIGFDESMIVVYGERTGAINGSLAFPNDSTVVFTPLAPFAIGDRVTAILVRQSDSSLGVLDEGYVWEFDIAPESGELEFATVKSTTDLFLTSIVSADLNDDAYMDIAFTGTSAGDEYLQVAYFDNGTFEMGDQIGLPDRVRPLYAGDLNRDGTPDFVLLHRGRSTFSIAPRMSICFLSPNGELSLEETIVINNAAAGTAELRGATINDFNQDGFLDIIVNLKNNAETKAAFVYLNDGSGHFSTPGNVYWFDRSSNAESIFSRDLNNSGFIDVGVGHSEGNATIRLYMNDGNAEYAQNIPDRALATGNRDLEISTSIDIDGDLLPDVLSVDYNSDELLIYQNDGVVNGIFRDIPIPDFAPVVAYSVLTNPNWLQYGDIDADGDLDLALTGSQFDSLQILMNDAGDYNQSSLFGIASEPANFSISDFNGDGALDYVVADTTGMLTLLINNINDYQAPDAPVLVSPADGALIPADSLIFVWNVPEDQNSSDQLHFRITFTPESGEPLIYESFSNPELFSPMPPVPQGQGTITFVPLAPFSDGTFSWVVEAWDGLLWSDPSAARQFTLDATPPTVFELSFPKADYADKWFAIQPGSDVIAAQLTYSEAHADYAVLTSNGIGGPFTYQNIPSGDNVSTELTFVPENSADGEYQLQGKVVDQVGLADSITNVVGVDHNPPTGTRASVDSDTSASREFRVYWSGGSDGTGSGLSGVYRVQYRVDGGPWILWISESTATDSLFSGQNNSTYEFEAASFDNVGFVELFSGVAEAQVTIDVFADDVTPPPAPLNIRANGENPSPWQANADFVVYWDLPQDESGIKASFWKIGVQPTSNDDFDDSGPPRGPANVTLDNDGVVPLYVWLSDSAGNVDYRNVARIDLRCDSTSPRIGAMTVPQPNARFVDNNGNSWYNSIEDKNFTLSVAYTEVNPEKAILTTDGLTDSLVNSDSALPSGTDVTTVFDFNIGNPADRLYALRTTIVDSADNRSSKNHRIGLDGNPPQNSLASGPAISDTEAFLVSWSAGADGAGSGIAAYDIYFKSGAGDWQLWFSASQPGDSTFVGQNGVEYRFESIAKDHVGHAESFSTNGEARVLVDLAANDNEPPPPPVNLRANGARPASPWTDDSQFTITWTKPDDESGVVSSYWKLGAPPVSNTDTSGVGGSGPAEGPMTIRKSTTGKEWLYVWLEDAKGNVDFNNADSVLLRFDDDTPRITSTRFLNPGYGDDWYSPEKVDFAVLEVTYNEQFASLFQLTSTDFNYNIQNTNPASGVGVKENVSLDLSIRPDLEGALTVSVTDSAGNVTQAIDSLRLDASPPVGSRASSPEESGSTSFQVSWSTGTDQGVGVSDTFDVYVKVNESGWTRWLQNYVGRSAMYENARDGNYYHFEVIARDWLGNQEIRTYEHESTTLVNVALTDSTAPGAPISLKANGANPSPWQRNAEFDITWQAPPDPSGTPKAYYKIGATPTRNSDTTGSFVGQPPMTVKLTDQGRQMLHVWLEDGAQNTDYRQFASVLLRYDATPPVIDSLVLADARPPHVANNTSWFNPIVPPHRTTLYVCFRDRYASSVLLEPSAVFESDGVVPRPGENAVDFELEFEGMSDNLVDLAITVADSAGNKSNENIKIGLDSTAPLNTMAQSPDTTRPGDFMVTWDVSQVVEEGAGLSGIFDIRVKRDSEPWQLWKARFEGTSTQYTGENGHTYAFEVAAYDNVGNKEQFTNVAESITTVVTQFDDTTPPEAPANIAINGFREPRWSNSSEFVVNWVSLPDPSGIARIYYKFYSPPTNRNDFDGSDIGTPPITIEFSDDGATPVYFWLQDGAGNSDFRKTGQAWLKYDGTPPVISNAIVSNAVYDDKWLNPDSTDQAQIRINYSEVYPDSIRLYFGSTIVNEQQTGLSPGQEQEIDFVIPLDVVNDGCYPLATVLTDSAGNRVVDSLFICLDSTPPTGALASSPERSVSNRFTVSWAGDGLGTDGDGSGLSGAYDLRLRIGDGQWFDVLTRAKTSSFTYVGTHETIFSFEVAAWDNAGNREAFTGTPETTTLVDTAFVDQTAPTAPVGLSVRGKNPSPWQNESEFIVEWQNPTDPSGIRAAFIKFDSKPESAADFSDSIAVETEIGAATIDITQENGRMVYVWLQDGRGNADYTQTASILLRYDATLPSVKSISAIDPAFQENWYNQLLTPEIKLHIIHEEDHPDSLFVMSSALEDKRIKITTQNTFVDTTNIRLDMTDVLDGSYWIYIALQDSAGNMSNEDSLQVHLDSQAPRVTHSVTDTVVLANTPVPIQATAADANELQTIRLVYWQGGERQRESIEMTWQSDSTYRAEIPAEVVADRGVEYLIVANDGVNQTRFPLTDENDKPLGLRVRLEQGLTMPEPLAFGSDENSYRMIAFPLEIEQPSGQSILENKLGPYEASIWRFFRWDPVETAFQEYPDMGDLDHGLAYWIIITRQGIALETGRGLTMNTIKPYTVVLKKGWNDIGLPFHFAVDWNDIIAASAIDTQKVQGPHAYNGRWEYPFENHVLQPWSGYSIYSDEDDISLVIPALEAQSQLAKSQPFAGRNDLEWAVEIKAQSNDMVDAANIFGCAKTATDAWDYGLDFVEAPEIGSYVSLYFEHENWTPNASRYTTDIRAPKKGHIWEFHIASNKREQAVDLSFRSLKALPESFEIKLIDEEASMTIDLVQDSTYTFQFSKNEEIRHFKIYAGDPEFMQTQEGELATLPKHSEPVRNFPNPFNGKTVISYELKNDTEVDLAIYNLLAQKVRQLRSGFQEKGFYQISWDARDDNGRELGTGVYIIRLETNDLSYTRKMVYMR